LGLDDTATVALTTLVFANVCGGAGSSPITCINFAVDAGTRKRFTANAVLKQVGINHRF